MCFNLTILNNEAAMNTSSTSQSWYVHPLSAAATVRSQAAHQSAIDAIGVVRAHFERDFAALIEQEPRLVRLALNEAEALAWQTGFPELVFPILAQEKADKVSSWHERQQSVRQKRPLHAFAA